MSYVLRGKASFPAVWLYECGGRLANRLFRWGYFLGDALDVGYTVVQREGVPANLIPSGPACPMPFMDEEEMRHYGLEEPQRFQWYRRVSGARLFGPVHSTLGILDLRSRFYPQSRHFLLADSEFSRILQRHANVAAFGFPFRAKPQLLRHLDQVRLCMGFPTGERQETERQERPLTVGIHVRRGDYALYRNGEYCYDLTYYHQLAEGLASGEKAQIIMFCSEADDREKLLDLGWTVGNTDPVDDLRDMSRCHAIVGPPSTFALWAALMGGIPIYQLYQRAERLRLHDFRSVTEEIMP